MEKIDPGLVKWGALVTVIVALEIIGEESLTHGFQRALEHDKMRYVALGAVVLTASHLLNILPEPVDPYQQIANTVDAINRRRCLLAKEAPSS